MPAGAGVPPPPAPGRSAHEIDFKVHGVEMQFVEVELDPGESAVAEAGSMMYMTPGINFETVFGDGSQQGQGSGLMGALLGAGKRLLTGESLFMTVFTNQGAGKQRVAFAAPYPGKILAMDLKALGGELICQKDSFLCAARGVSVGIAFQKRIGVGLFGGEGFIMQRLQGDGLTFVHAGGMLHALDLSPGETLRVDTGCLVALQPSVQYDIQFVGKVKTALFGGEGLFFATLTGPGRVWLQSLPFSRLADRIYAAAPKGGGGRREEGSLLGGLGGFLDGDNS
ncbi:MAG: TIGR00266 family protein [Vicinamibacterales bacterium]